MTAIQINVSRNFDGITYSLLPSIREMIRKLYPKSHPASRVFVAYDKDIDLQHTLNEPLNHIYPTLIGVPDKGLALNLQAVEFEDSDTGKVLKKVEL
jgi:hypothetical protein